MSTTHGMDAFFTRQKANEGIKVSLYLPSGQKTDQWIEIYGVDSDVFRSAEVEAKREAMRVAMTTEEGDKERVGKEKVEEIKVRLIAVLVKAWSFPQPCTVENVIAFLKEAPHISDTIDQLSSKRALFFAGVSKPLVDTPNTSSVSTSPRRARNRRSAQV